MQPTKQPDAPAFFRGVKAVAAYLGVSEKTIQRAVRDRRLPVARLGGALLFRRDAVDEAIEAATVSAVSVPRKGKRGVA